MLQIPKKTQPGPGRRLLGALGMATCFGLGACQGLVDQPARACPAVAMVADTDVLTRFAPGAVADAGSILAEATLFGINSACRAGDERAVVDIAFQIDATRGLGAGIAAIDLPFFIAVIDAGGTILAKEVFVSRLTFDESGAATEVERLVEDIPLGAGQRPVDFQVLVGFQLTADELRHNQRR